MVPQPRRSEGADRTLAAVLQRAAAAQRPWLQTPGDRSPELVGTRYHSPRTHCLIGYKFHTQVTFDFNELRRMKEGVKPSRHRTPPDCVDLPTTIRRGHQSHFLDGPWFETGKQPLCLRQGAVTLSTCGVEFGYQATLNVNGQERNFERLDFFGVNVRLSRSVLNSIDLSFAEARVQARAHKLRDYRAIHLNNEVISSICSSQLTR